MKNEYCVMQIGPSPNLSGGMKTVISEIMENSTISKEYNLEWIPSTDTSKKIRTFFISLKKINMCTKRNKNILAHVHMASQVSTYRKSLIICYLRFKKIPVIIHFHGGAFRDFYRDQPKILKKYISFVLKKSNAQIALTPSWKKYIDDITIKNDSVVISNCVSIPSESECIDKRKKNKVIHLTFLGRLDSVKGIFDLIHAASILKERKKSFVLNIAGEGERQKCIEMINNYNLKNYVKLLGWVDGDDKKKMFRFTDIFVLPSYYESFGIVLVEAMSYKIPIVASNGGQIPEVVENGINGMLFDAGDVEQLANAIERMMEDENLRTRLGRNGRFNAMENYSREVFGNKIQDLYNKLYSKTKDI